MPQYSRSTLLLFAALCLMWFRLPSLVQAACLDGEEQQFVSLINHYRQQHGLPGLAISERLDASANWMSADMGQKNYFSHTDSLGRDAFTRIIAFGYRYTHNTWKGENIAAGNATAAKTFAQWRNSPAHNANMLNRHFKVMGIARVYTAGSVHGWYWTNDFGGVNDTVTPRPAHHARRHRTRR